MSATQTPPSPSGKAEPPAPEAWPTLPVETEIYILPDGQVVIADLPAELTALLSVLAAAPSVAEQQGSD